ncbi:hypothetical protein GCM10020256_60990 [Streptomyces thermocoprophilus]
MTGGQVAERPAEVPDHPLEVGALYVALEGAEVVVLVPDHRSAVGELKNVLALAQDSSPLLFRGLLLGEYTVSNSTADVCQVRIRDAEVASKRK